MDWNDELNDWLQEASEEDLEMLQLFLQSTQTKRKQSRSTYISSLMQMEKRWVDHDTLEITMPNHPFLDNSIGIVHGGLTATLLDTAMGTLASDILPKHEAAVTLDLNVHYLAPGTGKTFSCIATLIKKGSQIIVTDGKVFNEKRTLIASATGTFFKKQIATQD